jgi:16S rRNA C1402 N4-methylase RsmH
VKQTFKALASHSEFEVLTKRPQIPSGEETDRNPRARSAKLRVISRIDQEERG